MKVWWITLILTYIFCLMGRMYGQGKVRGIYRHNIVFCTLAMAVLIVVSGLRNGIGDTPIYVAGFESDAPSTFGGAVQLLFDGKTKDVGFYFYEGVLKTIKNDSQLFIFVTAFITISLIFLTYKKYTDLIELSIYLFITTGCYLVTMNGVRQYLASAILFFSFPLIYERKWQYYIPIVLICSTIHKSALIFLPLYFVVNELAWGRVTKWILFIGIFLFITYPITGPVIANLLGETQYGEYKNALVSTGAGANMVRVAVMAVPVVLSYFGKEYVKGKEKYYNIIVNFSVINLIFILLATKFWIYARFNMYFSLYMIILLTWIIRYMFDEKNTKIAYICCMGLYAIYYFYEMHISLGYGAGYQHFIQSLGINL